MHVQPTYIFLIYGSYACSANMASTQYLPIYNPHAHSADITGNTYE